MKKGRIALALLLCLALLLSGMSLAAAEEAPAPNVRVMLRRLNLTDRIDLRLAGDYLAAWSGSRMLISSGEEITVQVREDRLVLFYREAAVDCGEALTLTRTRGSGRNTALPGLTISPWDGVYPGDLRLTIAGGQLQPVLTVNVEDYLLGVLPYEMSEDFPLEALKAQAVCARTYALSKADAKKEYDVVDTTNDQVFRPVVSGRSRTAQAVSETAGLVVTSEGALINCYYSASNGGQTELPSHVWSGEVDAKCYAIADDPYDVENPESLVRKAVLRKDGEKLPEAFEELVREAVFAQPEMKDFAKLPEAFRVEEISTVTLSNPRFAAPSRLMTRMGVRLTVWGRKYLPAETAEPALTYETDETGEAVTAAPTATPEPTLRLGDFEPAGIFTLSLPVFPDALYALGLSIYGGNNEIITVTETEDAFQLTAGRYGHGVGLSQRGAQWMAQKYHKGFEEILEFYYPGMTLKKLASGPAAIPTADPVIAVTPGPAATPTPRPTLMPVTTAGLPEGAWVASVEGIDDDSTLNLRAEPSMAGEILMRLYKHQQLIVLGEGEDPAWVHVRTDSAEGFVMGSYLEKVE